MRQLVALTLAGFALAACEKKTETTTQPAPQPSASAPAPKAETEITEASLAAFKPALPAAFESKDNPLTEDKITLGRALFYDTRLSASNKISCNTCHILSVDGADARKSSIGHKEQEGKRNSPTVYNAAGQFVQFWDGRAKDVEEQAKGPILNPIEMAMQSDKEAIKEVAAVKWYQDQFKKAFPGEKAPVNIDNVAKAIAAFERKLTTPSRWDKFLEGDKNALTPDEKAGFNKFVQTGCTACHMGTLVGGGMYQKLGLVQPWPEQKDLGRYEVTKNDADKMMFKVPSLRNVEKTSPYFNDGSVKTLEEAVKLMAKHQLGKDLSDADIKSIITWLKTLTGEIPKDYIAEYKVPAEIPPPPKK
jgi:cytochrome c peroxidase